MNGRMAMGYISTTGIDGTRYASKITIIIIAANWTGKYNKLSMR